MYASILLDVENAVKGKSHQLKKKAPMEKVMGRVATDTDILGELPTS